MILCSDMKLIGSTVILGPGDIIKVFNFIFKQFRFVFTPLVEIMLLFVLAVFDTYERHISYYFD